MHLLESPEYIKWRKITGNDVVFIKEGSNYGYANIKKKLGFNYLMQFGGMSGSGFHVEDESSFSSFFAKVEKKVKELKVGSLVVFDFDKKLSFYPEFKNFQKSAVYTLFIDLTVPDLFASFEKNNRKNIKKARNQGVVVMKGKVYFDDYFEVVKDMRKRVGLTLRNKKYYEQIFEAFGDKAELYVAKYEGKIYAGAIVVSCGDTLYHFDAATISNMGNIRANNLLHYELFLDAQKNGFKKFNFWGVDINPDSSAYGVYRFKKSFGGKLVEIDRFDKIYNKKIAFAKDLVKKIKNLK